MVPLESLGIRFPICIPYNYGRSWHRFRDIARYWSKISMFSIPLAFDATTFGTETKLEWWGRPSVRKLDDSSSHFDRIPACDRQTDGQTDGHLATVWVSSFLTALNSAQKALRCLQKEMATYRHWSVSLWRDPDDVSHCRILSSDKTEWRLISATLTLRMKMLFRGWPVMVHETHTRRRRRRRRRRKRRRSTKRLFSAIHSLYDWLDMKIINNKVKPINVRSRLLG